MGLSLEKGQKISLTKSHPGLSKVVFGLGWDVNKYDGGEKFDLDVVAFFTNEKGHVTGEQDFIFYNQPAHPSGALIYSGDNRTGEGNGDDETMIVNLNLVPSNIYKISFAVAIYEATERLQNFGMVDNSYIRAYNEDTGEELFKYELNEDFSLETGVIAGELYRKNNEWKFSAVGQGYNNGLSGIANSFGLNI